MNDFQKVADDAKKLLRSFANAAAIADQFEQAGSLQQARKEAEAALAELQPQTATAKKLLADAKAATEAAKTATAAEAVKAAKLTDEARAAAAQTMAEAARHAADMKAAGKEEAARLCADATAEVQAMTATRDALAKEAKALEVRVAEARAFIAKLKD